MAVPDGTSRVSQSPSVRDRPAVGQAGQPVRLARWFVVGAGAWLTFKPGSRPRRVAGLLLGNFAERVRAHPRLAGFLRRMLAKCPRLQSRLRVSLGNDRARRLKGAASRVRSPLADLGGSDLEHEIEGVRELYLKLAGDRGRRERKISSA